MKGPHFCQIKVKLSWGDEPNDFTLDQFSNDMPHLYKQNLNSHKKGSYIHEFYKRNALYLAGLDLRPQSRRFMPFPYLSFGRLFPPSSSNKYPRVVFLAMALPLFHALSGWPDGCSQIFRL